jgi:heptosyltransferase-1
LAQADPQNILLIHFGQLGDVVLALPTIKAVREKFADAKLTILSGRSTAGLIRLARVADEQIAVDRVALRDGNKVRSVAEILALVKNVRGRKFDLVIDLHSLYETNLLGYLSGARERLFAHRDRRSLQKLAKFPVQPPVEDRSMHHADRYAGVVKALGVTDVERLVRIQPPADAEKAAIEILKVKNLAAGELVGLFLGAGHRSRRWGVEKFIETARLLSDRKVAVLLGPEERDLRSGLQAKFGDDAIVVQELPIDVFFALLTKLDVMVTGDTGPMHLAAAAGAGIVMLSQAGAPNIFDPLAERLVVLNGTTLDALSPEAVLAAVNSLSPKSK